MPKFGLQGTIYPATVAAVPELVAVAVDVAAPGRVGAAWLVADFAGWTRVRTYLPKKLNLDAFDASARTALAEAVVALTPCLDDADAALRHVVALLLERTETPPAASVAVLHRRLADEQDPKVASALIGAIQAHDALTDAETARLDDAPAPARFAQAAGALRQGAASEEQTRIAADLWNTCVGDYQASGAAENLVAEVVGVNKLAALPPADLEGNVW